MVTPHQLPDPHSPSPQTKAPTPHPPMKPRRLPHATILPPAREYYRSTPPSILFLADTMPSSAERMMATPTDTPPIPLAGFLATWVLIGPRSATVESSLAHMTALIECLAKASEPAPKQPLCSEAMQIARIHVDYCQPYPTIPCCCPTPSSAHLPSTPFHLAARATRPLPQTGRRQQALRHALGRRLPRALGRRGASS